MPSTFPIGGWLRLACGLLLVGLAAALLLLGWNWGWGIGWMAWIPALALLVPGLACLGRRVLLRTDAGIERRDGRLWRRGLPLPWQDAAIEVLPTAGLVAVVWHRGGRSWPIATWITPAQAQRLCAWLDAGHPAGAWPRRAPQLPDRDR